MAEELWSAEDNLCEKVESLQTRVSAGVLPALRLTAPPPPPCACTPGPLRTPRTAPPRPRTAPSGAQFPLAASPAHQPTSLAARLAACRDLTLRSVRLSPARTRNAEPGARAPEP